MKAETHNTLNENESKLTIEKNSNNNHNDNDNDNDNDKNNGNNNKETDSNGHQSKQARNRERRKEIRRKKRVLESLFEKLRFDSSNVNENEIEEGINYFIELNDNNNNNNNKNHSSNKHDVYLHVTLKQLRQELENKNHSKGAILEALRWYIESHKQDLRRLIRKTFISQKPLYYDDNNTINDDNIDFVDYSFFATKQCVKDIQSLYHAKMQLTKTEKAKTENMGGLVDINKILNENDFYQNLPDMTIDDLYNLTNKQCIVIDKRDKYYYGEINKDVQGTKLSNESILKQYLNKIENERFGCQWYNQYKHENSFKNYEKMLINGRGNKSKPLESIVTSLKTNSYNAIPHLSSSVSAIFNGNNSADNNDNNDNASVNNDTASAMSNNSNNNSNTNNNNNNNNGNNRVYHQSIDEDFENLESLPTLNNNNNNIKNSVFETMNQKKQAIGIDIDIEKLNENTKHQTTCFDHYLINNYNNNETENNKDQNVNDGENRSDDKYCCSIYERYLLDGNISDRNIHDKELELVSRLSKQCQIENDNKDGKQLLTPTRTRRRNNRKQYKSSKNTTFFENFEVNYKTKVNHEINLRIKDCHKQINDIGIIKPNKIQAQMDIDFITKSIKNDDLAKIINQIKKDVILPPFHNYTNHHNNNIECSTSPPLLLDGIDSQAITIDSGTKFNPIELLTDNDNSNHSNLSHFQDGPPLVPIISKSRSKSSKHHKHRHKHHKHCHKHKHKHKHHKHRHKSHKRDKKESREKHKNNSESIGLNYPIIGHNIIYSYDKNNPLFVKINNLYPMQNLRGRYGQVLSQTTDAVIVRLINSKQETMINTMNKILVKPNHIKFVSFEKLPSNLDLSTIIQDSPVLQQQCIELQNQQLQTQEQEPELQQLALPLFDYHPQSLVLPNLQGLPVIKHENDNDNYNINENFNENINDNINENENENSSAQLIFPDLPELPSLPTLEQVFGVLVHPILFDEHGNVQQVRLLTATEILDPNTYNFNIPILTDHQIINQSLIITNNHNNHNNDNNNNNNINININDFHEPPNKKRKLNTDDSSHPSNANMIKDNLILPLLTNNTIAETQTTQRTV